MQAKAGTLEKKEASLGWKLILPTVIIIGGLIIYPVIYNIYLSFFEVSISPGKPNIFVGAENYVQVITDPGFWKSFGITILFTFLTVTGGILLGLGVALMMNRKFLGRPVVRALILLPYITPVIAIVFAWKYVFLPIDGPLVRLISSIGLMDPGV
ncbi:MAG: carbohydrate ABC transporter permease, partial [Kosmotogaceae bacterium]